MGDLTENFNKSSTLDPQKILDRDLEQLADREKRQIFLAMRREHEQAIEDREQGQKRERVDRIASFANIHVGRPSPELGTQRSVRPISREEVEAMIARGQEQGLPLDQVTPVSSREVYILKAREETQRFEAHEIGRLKNDHFKDERKLMDNLMTLTVPEIARDLDSRDHSRDNLRDEFNRRR